MSAKRRNRDKSPSPSRPKRVGAADDAQHRLGDAIKRLGPHLALAAVVWFVLAVAEVLAATYIAGTVVNHMLLPDAVRVTLICRELSLLAAAVVLVVLPASLLAERLGRRLGGRAIMRWLARALTTGLAIVLLGLLASSWATFRGTGRFLDAEGLSFVSQTGYQFFQHVASLEPYVLIFLPLSVLAGSLVISQVLPRMLARLSLRGLLVATALPAASIFVSLVLAVVGSSLSENDKRAVADPNYGLVYTVGDVYISSRNDHTGPMMHLWASRRNAELDMLHPALADESLLVEERPIISLEEYAHSVDLERFNRFNVIVIIVESLRTDQLVVCGGKRSVMPAVDALASEGLAFPNNYTQSSHSNYADLCPLSSHYPLRSAQTHVYPENPTYPRVLIYDVLKYLGYRTAVISSQNENWGGMANYLRTGSLDHFVDATTFDGPTYVPRGDFGFVHFIKGEKRSGKIDDRFTVSEAIRWVDEKPDQAFFIYMNLQNSHVPFETPADFPRPFGRDDLSFNIGFNNFPRHKRDEVMDIYADSLAYVDSHLAKLFAHLKKRGLWDSTIIVVTGDTGQAFYEHGFAGHANLLLNEVMKVPLVIRAPGMTGKVDRRLAQHVDVPPSVFSLLGLPPHPSFQGVNLLTPSPKKDRSVYLVAQCPLAHQAAVVRGGYKLIYDIRDRRHILFDLNRDPGEFKGRVGLNSEVAKDLGVRLDTWRKLQLDYYGDRSRQKKYYPPILKD